jgi:hypothetical protein
MRRLFSIAVAALVILLCGVAWAGNPYRHYILSNSGGTCVSTGNSVISTDSASPPAIQIAETTTQPFLAAPAADTCIVGVHGVFGAAAIDNLVWRASFESWAGAGNATGWLELSGNGDGSAVFSENTTDVADESSSGQIDLTGTTSYAGYWSECFTDEIGSDVYVSAWMLCKSGTCVSNIRLVEYDTAVCGSQLATNTIYSGNPGSSWVKKGGLISAGTWDASTSSYRIATTETGDGGVTLVVDAVQARAASIDTPVFAGCDTDATCSAAATLNSIHNPLSKAGAWTIRTKVQSPIDGAEATPARIILHADGTGGGNENRLDITWASDVLTCDLYDASGTKKTSTVAAAGNANTEYTVTMYHTSTGRLGCCWDSTCDATEATGALTDDRAADLDVACDGTNPGWVWVSDLEFFRRLVIP